jgi:hypothetical protein
MPVSIRRSTLTGRDSTDEDEWSRIVVEMSIAALNGN